MNQSFSLPTGGQGTAPAQLLKKLYSSLGHYTACTTYWSYCLMNQLYPRIFTAPTRSSYMGWQAICAAMVAFCRWMHSFMGHIPSIYRASATGGHSQSPYTVHQYILTPICMDTGWWKTSRTYNIDTINNQLLPPYSNTVCTTSLYSIACNRT